MPFKFKHLVQLLQALDGARERSQNANAFRQSTRTTSKPGQVKFEDHISQIIEGWFDEHESEIVRHGPSAVAFLSCLLPDQLPHRVYGLREKSLASLLCKVLFLPNPGRGRQLHEWEATGLDFATCLEKRVMKLSENDPPKVAEHEVTLEEIDEALQQLATLSRFAPEAVQNSGRDRKLVAEGHTRREKVLRPIMRRLQSYEAKWFVRMILKSYSPVEIPMHLILGRFHFLLPDIYPFQSTIEDAVEVLGKPTIITIPHNPAAELQNRYQQECAAYITPKLGVLIRRQEFTKARSLAHCCNEARGRTMSVERKYDGYYCQIHIDRSRGKECYKVISKSGKDQTSNWTGIWPAIQFGLQLDSESCPIKTRCTIEAEMLIWNSKTKTIEPFDKLRKHVTQHGRLIGADADSPRSIFEHEIIVAYDCLMLDDQSLIEESHQVRRQRLEQIVQTKEGLFHLGERQIINFGSGTAQSELREYFEHAIMQRWEGFVLKGSNDPYFTKGGWGSGIKLKHDYLKGLGDHADLCIIGARRDATETKRLDRTLDWTSFYLACLTNKEDVRRLGKRPEFFILDVLSCHNMSKETLKELNIRARDYPLPFFYQSKHYDVRIEQQEMKSKPPAVLFMKPIVVELTSARFAKPQNATYYSPRFPRDLKLHFDRPFTETHSFQELQAMAKESFKPIDPEQREEVEWIRQRLVEADPKKYQVQDCALQETRSPSCASTASADSDASGPSPAMSVQLREAPASPLIVTALTGTALAAAAGFTSDGPHSQSTASPSPPAAVRTEPKEALFFKPPPAPKRRATAPAQGPKPKRQRTWSDLSPDTAKVLTENNYTGPLDDMSVRTFRSRNGLIPNRKPPATSQRPTTKPRRKANYISPRKPRLPLATLENVPLTHGLQTTAVGMSSAPKITHGPASMAREPAKGKAEPIFIDLTSPDKPPPKTDKMTREHAESHTPTSSHPNAMHPPSTPSRPLDTILTKVLHAHPLVDQVHKSVDHNVIYVKVLAPGFTDKLWQKLAPIALDFQNSYKALPVRVTGTAPTQKRMIYFFNSGIRPSLFESSPLAKTPRQVVTEYDSGQHFFGAVLMEVDAGTVDVRCQAMWDKFYALEELRKLRTVPDELVVSPNMGG